MRPGLLVSAGAALAVLAAAPAAAQSGSERLDAFFEETFQRDLARSPLMQSRLGLESGQSRWDDIGEARRIEDAALARADLNVLYDFAYEDLTPQAQLSYRLFEFNTKHDLTLFKWRRNIYEISHRRGLQRTIPQTLIDNHSIETAQDARAYIARLQGVKPLLEQLVVEMARDEAAGTLPPRFDIAKVIGTARNLITGAPFDDTGEDSAIWADFRAKLENAEIPPTEKETLLTEARAAMLEGFGPGFEHLIAHLETARRRATDEDGVWKLRDGGEFYAAMLESETTLPISAEEVHRTGLAEVERIHGEMRAIMEEVGFEGALTEFFDFVRSDPRFYYESNEAGRAAYMEEMRGVLADMEPRLPQLFNRLPEAEMVLKRVEPWLEQSAGTAGYFAPSADGSRPGILYINQYDMRRLPRYEISALAYHEGVPGHHLQLSLSQALKGLPKFRAYGGYTAFSEGWGLYAEQLPKEIGLYRDPYQDFGRLSMELLRAGRLVVDSGVHAKRWTREEAIAWLDANTPDSHEANVVAADRYITLPGQATAYEIGKLEILELRARAKAALGEAFDIRDFNDAVLGSGPVPLPILEDNVEAWIETRRND